MVATAAAAGAQEGTRLVPLIMIFFLYYLFIITQTFFLG
jgi:hypothetical protein